MDVDVDVDVVLFTTHDIKVRKDKHKNTTSENTQT